MTVLNKDEFKDKILLISPYGLGDTLILCSLMHELEKKYNSSVHFIIKPTHELIMKMFEISEYSIRSFDEKELEIISKQTSRVKKGEYFIAHPEFHQQGKKILQDFNDGKINHVEIFRQILEIGENYEIKKPTFKPEMSNKLIEKISKIAPLEKIILFSPEAFSTKNVLQSVFEKKAKELKKQGYYIISSVTEKSKAIKGTLYIPLELNEAAALGLNCKKVYSTRSGFVDIISNFNQEMTVYYPDDKTYNLYNLKDLNRNNIEEIITPEFEIKNIAPFFQLICKNNGLEFNFNLQIFKILVKKTKIKYYIFGIPFLIKKYTNNHKIYKLFSIIPIYREKL